MKPQTGGHDRRRLILYTKFYVEKIPLNLYFLSQRERPGPLPIRLVFIFKPRPLR